AVQGSLTGRLVLSTLHTNDAANAVTRLVDIGVEAYKIAAALRGVMAQRLMRKLCPTCKQVWMETPPERLLRWVPKGTPLYRAAGCPDCAMTGYRGRFSIVEVLTVSAEVERRIAAGETADHIAAAALAAEPAPPPESLVEHFELLEEPAPPQRSGPHGLPAVKVLLVDDEDSLRKVMRDLLERDGYDVTEARDGVQALDQIDRVG